MPHAMRLTLRLIKGPTFLPFQTLVLSRMACTTTITKSSSQIIEVHNMNPHSPFSSLGFIHFMKLSLVDLLLPNTTFSPLAWQWL